MPLAVWYAERLVGTLDQVGHKVAFSYAPSWLENPPFAISLSLPLQHAPCSVEASTNFFDNLLPEEHSRVLTAQRLRLSEDDIFSLLAALGAECAGALAVLPAGEAPKPDIGRYRRLSGEELGQLIAALPNHPLMAGSEEVRLSLAGAQSKLSVRMSAQQEFYLPLNGAAGSHILKPGSQNFDFLPENEAFCMMLASALGLAVPQVSLSQTWPRAYVVQRYDRHTALPQRENAPSPMRVTSPTVKDISSKVPAKAQVPSPAAPAEEQLSVITRLHQEDFCQAMGLSRHRKYQKSGGPSLAQCFSLLDHCRHPQDDRRKLLHWVLFNYLIGNADAHAKNISLLYDTGVQPRLAPFYDLVSTAVYPRLSVKMAFSIGKQYHPAHLYSSDWKALAVAAQVPLEEVVHSMDSMTRTLSGFVEAAAGQFNALFGFTWVLGKVLEVVEKRSAAARRALEL